MKNILNICALFVLIVSNLFAQVAPIEIDSIAAGRAFARNLWDHYGFYGNFNVDNNEVWKNFSGTMDLKGRVTYFEVDGTVIVGNGDTPLPGIPYVDKGTITNFWLCVNAMKGDDQLAWGFYNTPRLTEHQPVVVVLYPEEERGFVGYDDDSSDSERPRLVNEEGNEIGWYDSSYSGFSYYLDPLEGPITAYVVVNGRRVASFWLDPFSPAKSQDNSLVNIELTGGVSRVLMNDSGYYNQSATTDGQTEFDGKMVPAKVFILDTEGASHHLTLRVEKGLNISASVYDVSGKRFDLIEEVGFYDAGYNDDGVYYGEYQIPQGYGKVMVVITSINGKQQPFRAFFSKGYGGKG